jgi:hypothetical protein
LVSGRKSQYRGNRLKIDELAGSAKLECALYPDIIALWNLNLTWIKLLS